MEPSTSHLAPFNRRVSAFWHRERNFGDQLTQCLLARLGVQAVHASPGEAEAIGIGSILEQVPATYNGIVLGAGLMFERSRREFSHARFLSVRGRMTAERCGLQNVSLGDLGLAVRHLFRKLPPINYQLAVVPHYVDREHPFVKSIRDQNPNDVTVVDVRSGPRHVLEVIAGCEYVVSSSLHGLITAHALGKPASWIRLSNKVYGSGFKFRDHFSSMDLRCQPLEIHASISFSSVLRKVDPPNARWQERGDQLFQALTSWCGSLPTTAP